VQAIANVLANAIKFTPRPDKILLCAEADLATVTIRIKDPGIGIEADSLTRIFELFAQNEVGGAQIKAGLGIGLSLTRQFIEMHGGSVCAFSEGAGCGSEFVLTLPRDSQPAQTQPKARPALGTLARNAPEPVTRVLVVDDNRDAADMLVSLFRSHGYAASSVYSGHDALREATQFVPDAIVMDLAMPGLDGYEAARRLRQSPGGRSYVMVALTGWGQEGTRRKALEAGFDFHAVKPVDIEVLKSYIAQSRLRRQDSPATA
jgi:CheY-like chemotaxis protein